MTMSISSAPAATASAVSASLISSDARPLGNAVATAATETSPSSGSPCAAPSACDRVRHHVAVDADRGDARAGRVRRRPASAPSRRASAPCPGVSAPSRVVRSMSSMILSSAQAFEVVLIERVPRPAARCSSPTASTPGSAVQVAAQVGVVGLTAEQLDGALGQRLQVGSAHRLSLSSRSARVSRATLREGSRPQRSATVRVLTRRLANRCRISLADVAASRRRRSRRRPRRRSSTR